MAVIKYVFVSEPIILEGGTDKETRESVVDFPDGTCIGNDATHIALLQALLQNKNLKISLGEAENGTTRAKNKVIPPRAKH